MSSQIIWNGETDETQLDNLGEQPFSLCGRVPAVEAHLEKAASMSFTWLCSVCTRWKASCLRPSSFRSWPLIYIHTTENIKQEESFYCLTLKFRFVAGNVCRLICPPLVDGGQTFRGRTLLTLVILWLLAPSSGPYLTMTSLWPLWSAVLCVQGYWDLTTLTLVISSL